MFPEIPRHSREGGNPAGLRGRRDPITHPISETIGEDVKKLQQGDRLPSISLKLIGGDTLTLPEQMPSRYLALLFYRAHW